MPLRVLRTLSVDFLQSRNQLLREIFFRVGPEQPSVSVRILLHLGGEIDQLVNVAAHALFSFRVESTCS